MKKYIVTILAGAFLAVSAFANPATTTSSSESAAKPAVVKKAKMKRKGAKKAHGGKKHKEEAAEGHGEAPKAPEAAPAATH